MSAQAARAQEPEDIPQLGLQAFALFAVSGVQGANADAARTIAMLSMFFTCINIVIQLMAKCVLTMAVVARQTLLSPPM